jgi:hypothetical protein
MNKKTIFLGVAALVLTGMAFYPSMVEAYQGEPGVQGPNCDPERHEAMLSAFENNDYNSWKEQMQGRGRVADLVTEDNFGRFAEAHRLALEGDTEGAAQIREELGLGMRNQDGQGYRGGNRDGSHGKNRMGN